MPAKERMRAAMTDIDRKGYLFSNHDLLKLIVPLVIEQFLAIAVGMADTIMIAAVGESAVSAISLVDSINILLINIFGAMATGGAVVCGQFLGKRQRQRACMAADQLLLFNTAIAAIIMILVYAFRNFILSGVFGQIEPVVRRQADVYLLIVTASIPFISLYNSGAALFRTMGNSKISMYMSLLMNGINIIGNAILIYGFKMGVAGAAIPTLVSRVFAAVVIYCMIRSPKHLVHTSTPVVLRPQFSMIKKILYIGVPNGLENSLFQLGKILVLSLISTFGTASIAANAVANNIATFQCLPGMAVGLALTTVISRCVGAGDYQQARYYNRKLLSIAYVSMLLINVIIAFMLPMVLHAYHLSDAASAFARQIVLYHGVMCCVVWPLAFSVANTLRAANDVKYTMTVSILSMWIFRIGFSYLMGQYLKMDVFGVWVAMTIDWVVRALFFMLRYKGRRWELHKI